MKEFKRCLKTLSGATTLSSPRVQTSDGTQSQLSTGNSVPMGNTNAWVGLALDVTPHLVRNRIRLLLGLTSTELAAPSSNNLPSIKTNLAFACQATLPNAHALVLDGGNGCWLLLSPTLIDARGKSIKP